MLFAWCKCGAGTVVSRKTGLNHMTSNGLRSACISAAVVLATMAVPWDRSTPDAFGMTAIQLASDCPFPQGCACYDSSGRRVSCDDAPRPEPRPRPRPEPTTSAQSAEGAGCAMFADDPRPASVESPQPSPPAPAPRPSAVNRAELVTRNNDAIRFLSDLHRDWRTKGDLRNGFAKVHECMARGILNAAQSGRFQNPDWMLRMNYRFAVLLDYALDALWERNGRTKRNLPKAWSQAFDIADKLQRDRAWPGGWDPRIAVDRVTLVMASAHIFNDLTLALHQEGCASKADFASILPILDRCEAEHIGVVAKGLKDIGSLIGVPGTNSLRQWRSAVWSYACEGGPHPGNVFR